LWEMYLMTVFMSVGAVFGFGTFSSSRGRFKASSAGYQTVAA
jgi:hypothetical protein